MAVALPGPCTAVVKGNELNGDVQTVPRALAGGSAGGVPCPRGAEGRPVGSLGHPVMTSCGSCPFSCRRQEGLGDPAGFRRILQHVTRVPDHGLLPEPLRRDTGFSWATGEKKRTVGEKQT